MDQGHFTSITFTSATLADFGGIKTGHIRQYYNNAFGCMQTYVLVYNGAGTTLVDGGVCKLKTGQTTVGRAQDAVVVQNGANTTPGFCVNQAGTTIADAVYWWALTGRCVGYGLGGTVGDGVQFTGGAAGIITAVGDGLDAVLGIAISDVTTTVANKVFWMLPAGGVFDLA